MYNTMTHVGSLSTAQLVARRIIFNYQLFWIELFIINDQIMKNELSMAFYFIFLYFLIFFISNNSRVLT